MKLSIAMASAVVLATGCGKMLEKMSPKPVYEAEARILVREPSGETSLIGTQCEMIQSLTVLKAVVTNLRLQEAWGTNGQSMTMERACGEVSRSLTVEPYRDTQLIAIRVARPDPEEAARIVNEVAAVFRDMRVSEQRRSLRRGIEVIESEMNRQQAKVDAAEAKCEELRKSLGISVLWSMDESHIPRLKSDQVAAHAEANALKQRMDKLQGLSDEEMATVGAVMLNDESAAAIHKRIVEIETGAVPAGTNVTVEALKVELGVAVARIRRALQSQYAVADAKAKALDSELDALANPDDTRIAPYRKARREAEVQRAILDALRARVAQEGIEIEVPRTIVEIVDPAEPPTRPAHSR